MLEGMLESLKTVMAEHAPMVLALGGMSLGLLFGALVTGTNFCVMGALSDVRNFGDGRRLRAWLLAIAVAMLGTHALVLAGALALDKSMYVAPTLNWLGQIVGGVIFGFGMVYAGGCPTRQASRLGGGDLRGLVVLMVTGVAAFMTIGGVLGPARAMIETATALRLPASTQTLPALAGLSNPMAGFLLAAGVALAVASVALADSAFRKSWKHIGSGLGVGLAVVAGWALTGLAYDDLAARPVAPLSLSFVRPAGDTLEWLARATALGLPGFGVATLTGTILGGLAITLWQGRFRLAGFSGRDDTGRHLAGACLMGIGGVAALGCTIGQGVTGLSTLAVGSLLAVGAIVAGGWLAFWALERSMDAA